MIHPDGFYPHTLGSGEVFIGVLLQYLVMFGAIWFIVAFCAGYFMRRTARRSMATFRFGQGRRDKWN